VFESIKAKIESYTILLTSLTGSCKRHQNEFTLFMRQHHK